MAIEAKDGTAILEKLSIVNNSGTSDTDLSPIYFELNVYESIANPGITASVILRDGTDLKASLPIVGG